MSVLMVLGLLLVLGVILAVFDVDPKMKQLIYAVVILAVLFWVLRSLGVFSGVGFSLQ